MQTTNKKSCRPKRSAVADKRAADMVDVFTKLNDLFADGNHHLDAVMGATLLSAAIAGRGMKLSREEFMQDASRMWDLVQKGEHWFTI